MSTIDGCWDRFASFSQPQPTPGRTEIVVIAGFLGLHLARRDGLRIWLTPPAFALRDVATELRSDGAGTELFPDGLNEVVYGDIVRDLRAAGFQVHAFAFDFRRSVVDVARDLAAALAALGPNRRFALVAHSLGALVAAVYPHVDPDWQSRIERAIFLGGTLGGTFEVVDAAIGRHPIIGRLSALSVQNSSQEYAACMRTWQGLYDMLPDPALFPGGDRAFEAASWPRGLQPDPALLASAARTRTLVATSPLFASVPTAQILSTRFSTRDAYLEGPIGEGPRSAAGDGTVTLPTAGYGGARVYRVDLPHTLIPLDAKAIRGVIELLATGTTSLPEVTAAETHARIEGTEPTIEDIVAEYVKTTLAHPERIPRLLEVCLYMGVRGR